MPESYAHTTAYEILARERKARLLAEHMMQRLCEMASEADEDTWAATALMAKQHPPGRETQAEVVRLLRGAKL